MTLWQGLETSRVLLAISDPFELSQTLEGEIVGVDPFGSGADTELDLVLLAHSLTWRRHTYNHLAFSPRYGRGLLSELEAGAYVVCGGIGVDDERAKGPSPWGMPAWRGGLSVLATLELLDT